MSHILSTFNEMAYLSFHNIPMIRTNALSMHYNLSSKQPIHFIPETQEQLPYVEQLLKQYHFLLYSIVGPNRYILVPNCANMSTMLTWNQWSIGRIRHSKGSRRK